MSGRLFPIQDATPIPWAVAERAYEVYARRYGTGQSLERLAERGGFGVAEMDMLYPAWRADARGIAAMEQEIASIRARVRELEAALALFGHHRKDCASRHFVDESLCAVRHACTCGLDAALRGGGR